MPHASHSAMPAPRFRREVVVQWACRICLAALFVLSSGAKLLSSGTTLTSETSTSTLSEIWWHLPRAIHYASTAFSLVELAVAVLLLTPAVAKTAVRAVLFMTMLWAAFIVALHALGASPESCKCFGTLAQLSYGQHYGILGAFGLLSCLHISTESGARE